MDPNINIAYKRMMNAQKSAIGSLVNYVCDKGEDVDIKDNNGTHKGSAINLSNPRDERDSIYVYVWSDDPEFPAEVKHVDCIYYDYKYENVMLHSCGYRDSYENFDEIAEDYGNWHPIVDSECFVAQTLFSIFESIDQYVED